MEVPDCIKQNVDKKVFYKCSSLKQFNTNLSKRNLFFYMHIFVNSYLEHWWRWMDKTIVCMS